MLRVKSVIALIVSILEIVREIAMVLVRGLVLVIAIPIARAVVITIVMVIVMVVTVALVLVTPAIAIVIFLSNEDPPLKNTAPLQKEGVY